MIRTLVIVLAIGTFSTTVDWLMDRRHVGWKEVVHDVMWGTIGLLVAKYA